VSSFIVSPLLLILSIHTVQHLELKHPEEFRKCQVERGKELEVKKEKLDRKMAVGESLSSSRSSDVEHKPARAISEHSCTGFMLYLKVFKFLRYCL